MIRLKRQKGDNLKASDGVCVCVCVWERERVSADTTEEISTGAEKKIHSSIPYNTASHSISSSHLSGLVWND